MKYHLNIDPRLHFCKLEQSTKLPSFVKFVGGFSESNVDKFKQDLIIAENNARESKQTVIPIVIDSYGGDIYALFGAMNAISAVDQQFKIATIIEGKAMSAGIALATCGHEGYRFAAPNASIMIHEAARVGFMGGKNEEFKASAAELDRVNEVFLRTMSRNCGHHDDYFAELIHKRKHANWFLDPEEAKFHNIINEIGIPRFEVDIEMKINFK